MAAVRVWMCVCGGEGGLHGWFLSLKRGKVIQDVSPCPLLFSEVECQHTEGRRAHLSTNKRGFVWDVVATSVRTKSRLHSTSTGPELLLLLLLLRGPWGGGAGGDPAWRSNKNWEEFKLKCRFIHINPNERVGHLLERGLHLLGFNPLRWLLAYHEAESSF